jgi:hypothetical protein
MGLFVRTIDLARATVRIGLANLDMMTVRRSTVEHAFRNPQILDGLSALPHEKPA